VVEAALKADSSGQLVKFPFINNQLQRILCRWAYKLCTAGGFRLPAFALADDGYLALHNGRVYSGSNWMPEGHAITSLGSRRLLEVRYGLRAMRRRPGFTCASVLSISLGIAVTAVVFAAIKAVLINPLPYTVPSLSFRTSWLICSSRRAIP
jgi:hypothetical protein